MIIFSPAFWLSWSTVKSQIHQHNPATPFSFEVHPCLLNHRRR